MPLFPDAIDAVTTWFDGLGQAQAERRRERESARHCRVWRWTESAAVLDGTAPLIVLDDDFPLTPARIEFDTKLCLRLPHVERKGNFCHGVEFDPADFDAPVAAVHRVLTRLLEFLDRCADRGWVEAEFHRERQSYWARHADGVKAPAGYRTRELLLDVDANIAHEQEAAAVHLDDGRAFATVDTDRPERVAKSRSWPVGTIVRGSALIARLPSTEHWTPSTWPRTFADLDDLLSQLCGSPARLSAWHRSQKWPNKAPLYVVLLHETAVYGWQILPAQFGRASQLTLVPINVARVDRQWNLCRDHHAEDMQRLASKRVVVFGGGSLGAPLIELLTRAGVGSIDVVDPQVFEPENISRHVLGASSIGYGKAVELCARLKRQIPGASLTAYCESAMRWCTSASQRPPPDLVIDCTGEASVRIGLSKLRATALNNAPVVMAWMEPFGAAAHVVIVAGSDAWPTSDPASTAVNMAKWPADVEVDLPGCGHGFHPYGVADAWGAASMVAERILAILHEGRPSSGVWSLVRDKTAFTDRAPLVTFNRAFPVPAGMSSVVLHRPLAEALQDA